MVLTGLSFDPGFISVVLLQFKLGSDFKQIEKGFGGNNHRNDVENSDQFYCFWWDKLDVVFSIGSQGVLI